MALFVNGGERQGGSGFDIPGTTEIGFGGGLKRGEGNYYLYGLTTSRIRVVRAESRDQAHSSEAETVALIEATADDGSPMRFFVLVRPPVDNVTALMGLDRDGQVVQRIPLPGPFE
ncbi:hypothetical protein [Nocardioides sp.]|uniref:hypothetical protein n=1 Tax=Nocardioides sp. TaxID=35761 RepID=UPI00271B0B55|nr:hypothetical protein [Nocardioides sp.]MDO9455976.1 hypothetical protein [Nocardioides sp.]